MNVGCSHERANGAHVDGGRGAELFAKNCVVCHSSSADSGRIGPSLANEGHKRTLAQIVRAIESPDPPMPKLYPGTLSAQDVADVAAYVKTL
jgi:mono/diheme cytochrome c family protein